MCRDVVAIEQVLAGESRAYGGFDGSPYEGRSSKDLLLVVR